MIQRRQTLFLLVALILTIVCLSLPIAVFEPSGMGVNTEVYNLWIKDGSSALDFKVCPLFVILLITCPINLWTIFKFHDRKFQARLCVVNILLIFLWYVAYMYFTMLGGLAFENQTLHFAFAACLPFISIVLYIMARHSIIADEKLLRAADRIR